MILLANPSSSHSSASTSSGGTCSLHQSTSRELSSRTHFVRSKIMPDCLRMERYDAQYCNSSIGIKYAACLTADYKQPAFLRALPLTSQGGQRDAKHCNDILVQLFEICQTKSKRFALTFPQAHTATYFHIDLATAFSVAQYYMYQEGLRVPLTKKG